MNTLFEKLKIYGPKTFISFVLFELYNRFYVRYFKKSYSQLGEDLIIDRQLKYKKKGTYVDIGAYDPDRFSNTKRFYLKGWSGINIEPNVVNYNRFIDKRKRDINLNIGIGNTNKKLIFYSFIPDSLSTFSKKIANKYQKEGFLLQTQCVVPVKTLSTILMKYCQKKQIDFISIDTEGFELEVLQSNDWNKFRPTLLCLELNSHSNSNDKKTIENFILRQNYEKIYQNNINCIYHDLKKR